MSCGFYYWIWLQILYHSHYILADNSPYSLQAAVDELNHQEYPLNSYTPNTFQRQNYYYNDDINNGYGGIGSGLLNIPPNSQNYWENENVGDGIGNFMLAPKSAQRNRLNKQLRKFLEREYYINNINNNNNNKIYEDNNNGLSLTPFDGYEFDEDNNKLLPADFNMDEQKRVPSYFRERDLAYNDLPAQGLSMFREREIPQMNTNSDNNDNELSEQFLHEIENGRKNRYRGDVFENFLNKYNQHLDNNDDATIDNYHQLHIDRDKRMRVPPYYLLMQKKRSYPILPWLPYTAEHNGKHTNAVATFGSNNVVSSDVDAISGRNGGGGGGGGGGANFPVAKRSAITNRLDDTDINLIKWKNINNNNNNNNHNHNHNHNKKSVMKTDENVEKELSELFDDDNTQNNNNDNNKTKDEKKRSIDEHMYSNIITATGKPIITTATITTTTNRRNNSNNINNSSINNEMIDKNSIQIPLESIKLTDMHLGMQHHHNHDEHGEHDHHHNNNEQKQNKGQNQMQNPNHMYNKDFLTNINNNMNNILMESNNNNVNRDDIYNDSENHHYESNDAHFDVENELNQYLNKDDPVIMDSMALGMREKKSIDWSKYFGLDRKKKSTTDYNNNSNYTKKFLDPIKLENMDMKLQAMEDFIINDTIKYTGAHEGVENPQEKHMIKNRILSRLATAYNLEKMRQTLAKLRQASDNENHLLRNMIEADENNVNQPHMNELLELMKNDKFDNMARSSINNDENNINIDHNYKHELNSAAIMKKSDDFLTHYPERSNHIDDFKFDDYLNVRSKLLNMAHSYNKDHLRRNEQCPILETIIDHCRSVDLLSGDLNQELLQLCTIHQICYLCSTSRLTCDYQYLEEADKECGYLNNECQSIARSVLMILRGSSVLQLGPRQCLKNTCLHNIVREIGINI